MRKHILVRITTIPLSLNLLLRGQMKFMKENGFEVYAASAGGPEIDEIIRREGAIHKVIPLTRKITPWQDIKAIYTLYRWLKKLRPDIVHTHTPKAGFAGMLAARLAGVPHRLHTVAGMPLLEAHGVKRIILEYIESLTYHCATCVFPNSASLKAIILNEFSVQESKVSVIGKGSSNGIDTSYFARTEAVMQAAEKLKGELGLLDNMLVFTFVGRIVSDKGINELVGAFLSIINELPEARLLLVGSVENDLDPLLPETIRHIKATPEIITTGFQKDVRPYLAISDLFVFPSYREGFPNVVLQAACMQLPCIVSDINGCNEIIIDGENGRIIPPKNISLLGDAMLDLARDKEMRIRLAGNARKGIVRNFEQKRVWDSLLEVYRSLC